jgi:hypothetical protein
MLRTVYRAESGWADSPPWVWIAKPRTPRIDKVPSAVVTPSFDALAAEAAGAGAGTDAVAGRSGAGVTSVGADCAGAGGELPAQEQDAAISAASGKCFLMMALTLRFYVRGRSPV